MSNLSRKSTAAKIPNMPIDSFIFLVLYNANLQHIKYVLGLKKVDIQSRYIQFMLWVKDYLCNIVEYVQQQINGDNMQSSAQPKTYIGFLHMINTVKLNAGFSQKVVSSPLCLTSFKLMLFSLFFSPAYVVLI